MILAMGAKVKRMLSGENTSLYLQDISEQQARAEILYLLKEHKAALKKQLPQIKKTTARHQAAKLIKFYDYVIGRMIFFKEDFKTAYSKALTNHNKGEL